MGGDGGLSSESSVAAPRGGDNAPLAVCPPSGCSDSSSNRSCSCRSLPLASPSERGSSRSPRSSLARALRLSLHAACLSSALLAGSLRTGLGIRTCDSALAGFASLTSVSIMWSNSLNLSPGVMADVGDIPSPTLLLSRIISVLCVGPSPSLSKSIRGSSPSP
jgi:hypothetical protein